MKKIMAGRGEENHAKLIANTQSYNTRKSSSSGTSLIIVMGSEITSMKLGNKIMNEYKIQLKPKILLKEHLLKIKNLRTFIFYICWLLNLFREQST